MAELILNYIGNDDWHRPVYKTNEGRLFLDIDPRCVYASLHTLSGNNLYGEPEMPIYAMEQYKDIENIVFVPERKTW